MLARALIVSETIQPFAHLGAPARERLDALFHLLRVLLQHQHAHDSGVASEQQPQPRDDDDGSGDEAHAAAGLSCIHRGRRYEPRASKSGTPGFTAPSSSRPSEHEPARVDALAFAQLLFDPDQLVVLRHPLGAQSEPVLMNPAFVATARSAMKVSSVSPERCEMTVVYPCVRASLDRLAASR